MQCDISFSDVIYAIVILVGNAFVVVFVAAGCYLRYKYKKFVQRHAQVPLYTYLFFTTFNFTNRVILGI